MPITEAEQPGLPSFPPSSLRTDRLCLRYHHMGDLDQLVTLIGAYDVARWLARVPHPYGPGDGEDFITATGQGLNDSGELVYAIADPADDTLLGGVGLIFGVDGAELGYWLGLPFHGRGYAREAVTAVLDLAFGKLDLAHVHADVRTENTPSRRLLEGLGFSEKEQVAIYQIIGKRYVMGPRYELRRAQWRTA